MDSTVNNNLVSNLPEERDWEYKQICVTRVPGYGFGIAVSGGRDNPHFASGDPSIAVSDVLAAGPAERILHVNDRIVSVNGISLQNVDYATAVQVLRDSGDTVTLVIKRRILPIHHGHSLSSSYPSTSLGINNSSSKVTLLRNSKKEDFGIILGCKLFIKEISPKTKEHLLISNQTLMEGDFITKLNNTNCNDLLTLKEAKKIIDSTKDKLTITRDLSLQNPQALQNSSNLDGSNFHKSDDYTLSESYNNQNLYVQPPTRNYNANNNGGFEEKSDRNIGPNFLMDDKSNLTPRSRSRAPVLDGNNSLNDKKSTLGSYGRSHTKDLSIASSVRKEDYYSSPGQLYDEDPIIQKKQSIPNPRFVTFHKEGSVGIRLTGGNFVGIFVTAVQPGSPASFQGLQPGDKILKVNDMDMNGVTREEAVLFLLSLQDCIELIVQYCKEEYDNIVESQKSDSFYIKTHFHYANPAKGELAFRSGEVFHVIDTLYNGVVGSWQVLRIGRNNQEMQKGIIPNKSRAEELATAQFNAAKKEKSINESRGSFFKRRKSSNRRSKSLGKEHWDDILFSDTVSKFPAYERVLMKHPNFIRPVILFGPIADLARDKLIKDFPDKFIIPQMDGTSDDRNKSQKISNIIKLSVIRDFVTSGKHAILDITPNAVERLNYAQMYPIAIFFKVESKLIIKQLRQDIPKSAHKSSKKLFEQCQKLDKVWNHIFSAIITVNDNTDNWYRKIRDIIDRQQGNPLWISESKPEESLSDDFLFPMSSLRLSYASSPESDNEQSPLPLTSGLNSGRLAKASSDPSVVIPDNSPSDVLPPYQAGFDTRRGFNDRHMTEDCIDLDPINNNKTQTNLPQEFGMYQHKRQSTIYQGYCSHSKDQNLHEQSPKNLKGEVYGQVPNLPPRIDRGVKPLLTIPTKSLNGRSAHERLFGTKSGQSHENMEHNYNDTNEANTKLGSIEKSQNYKTDSLTSYESFNKQSNNKLGPNAHDDLKTTLSKIETNSFQNIRSKFSLANKWEQNQPRQVNMEYKSSPHKSDFNGSSTRNSPDLDKDCRLMDNLDNIDQETYSSNNRKMLKNKNHVETKTDYGKYNRINAVQDYTRNSLQDLSHSQPVSSPHHSFIPEGQIQHSNNLEIQQMNLYNTNVNKPVPPPKPKNYKGAYKGPTANSGDTSTVPTSVQTIQHGKSHSNPVDPRNVQMNYYHNMPQNNYNWNSETAVRYNMQMHGPYDLSPAYDSRRNPNISYASRSEITSIAHHDNPYALDTFDNMMIDVRSPEKSNFVDLQGSREQRGSAFELYRKPIHPSLR